MGLFHIANATSLTGLMDQFEKGKGAANALAISLRFGFGMLGAIFVSLMSNETIYPYVCTVLIFSSLATITGLKAGRTFVYLHETNDLMIHHILFSFD